MNSLYLAQISRRDFGDILTPEGLSRLVIRLASQSNVLEEVRENCIFAIWPSHPRESPLLPSVLVCSDESVEDWAAWITTFVAKIRPFSAYMRLISQSQARILFFQRNDRISAQSLWPMSGLVLGEYLASSRFSDKTLETLPANAHSSALSFLIFRAAILYPSTNLTELLSERWESVRRVTKQRSRLVERNEIAKACSVVLSALNVFGHTGVESNIDGKLSEICHDILAFPGQVPRSLTSLPYFDEVAHKMAGSREERVVAFNSFLKQIDDYPSHVSGMFPFMLGYFASRIAPGTMRHFSVLDAVINKYPASALWYGFFAGCGNLDSSSNSRSGIDLPISARRIVRDLWREGRFTDPPECDIGYEELLVLSRSSVEPLYGLISTTQGTTRVELFPCVIMTISTMQRPTNEASIRTSTDRQILASLGREIEALRRIYQDLVGDDQSAHSKPQQENLFTPKRKKKT